MNEQRPRLLIVDDTPDNILLLSETLKDTYQVQAATNGARAIQIASRVPAPDLIMLDVMMPDMDGYEVCRALQDIPTCAKVPVIFVTALSGVGDEERGLALGAVDYITKPFNPSLVKARVRNHIELKRHRDYLEQEVQKRTQELLQATLARELLDNDLRLALKLQMSMLPPARFHRGGAEIVTSLVPACAIGGDLYDYIRLDGERLLFAVGDVSDKGVAAALFMVRVVTLLHGLAPLCRDPAQLLRDLNAGLCVDNDTCMFVTLGCGIADLKRGEILYASGGHEPPVLASLGQPARRLELEGGPALGLEEEAEFPLNTLQLTPEQCLVLVTDGVTEANSPRRELFGHARLVQALSGLSDCAPAGMLAHCLRTVEDFTAGAEPYDDLTMLILQLRP